MAGSMVRESCVKKSFLLVYDYGMGGVWAIVNARSKDEIEQKYPMLKVQETRPNWMTDELYSNVASSRTLTLMMIQPVGCFLR
jgi:hypothetical protein